MLVPAMETQDTKAGHKPARKTKADLLDKERRAAEMYLAKVPLEAIAKEVGYADRSGARKAAWRCLERQSVSSVGDRRLIELATIDLYQRALMRKSLDGDVSAVAESRKLMELRLKLTPQLAVPTEVEISGSIEHTNVTKDEFATWVDAAHAQFLLDKERKTESAEA